MDSPTTWLTLGALVSASLSAVPPERQYFYSSKHYFGAHQDDDSDIPGDTVYYESIKPVGSFGGESPHYIHTLWMQLPETPAPPVWRPPNHRGVIRLPFVPTVEGKKYPVSPYPSSGRPSDEPYYNDISSGLLQGLSHHSQNGAASGIVSSILSQGEENPQADTVSAEQPSRIFDPLLWSAVFPHLQDAPKTKKTYRGWWENSQLETKHDKKKTAFKRKFKHGSKRPARPVIKHKVRYGATRVTKHPAKPKPERPANRFPTPTAKDVDDYGQQLVPPALPLKPTRVGWSVSRDKLKEPHIWWRRNFETKNKKKTIKKPKRPAKPNPSQANPAAKPLRRLGTTPTLGLASPPGGVLSTGEETDIVVSRRPATPEPKKLGDEVVVQIISEGGATGEGSSGAVEEEPKVGDTHVIHELISSVIENFRNASEDRGITSHAPQTNTEAPQLQESRSAPKIVTTTPRSPEDMSDAEVEKAYNFHPPGTVVEMALFYDSECRESFVETFGSTDKFQDAVWTILAQVQIFYRQPWLKRAVNIVATQLTYLEEPPNELMRSEEADELLKGFTNFTTDKNVPDGEPGHWDVALLFTGKDIHAHNNGKKDTSVLGKAYIGGVCSNHFGNVIVEFGSVNPHRRPMTTFGLQSSSVLAHELAHNLGVYHDGPPANERCSLDRYLMGPWRTANTTTWWSNCSLSVLEDLPKVPKSTCLKPLSPERLRDLLPLNLWRNLPLPGQRWDGDDQCRIFLKSPEAHQSMKPADMKEVCRKLECASPTRIGLFNAGHALEGTYCGGSNWCHRNRCVPFPKSLPVVEGGWSDWNVSDCRDPCLEDSVALIQMKRSCTMPARKNTLGGCEGDSVTVRPCDINANNKGPKCDRKRTNQEFINEKCAIFSHMRSELKPTGTQVPYSADQSWRACAIHCGYHHGAFIPAKFFLNDESNETGVLPDGARCHFDEKTGTAYYCQQGLCATLLQSLAGLELEKTSQVLELDEEDWAENTAGRLMVEQYMEYVPGEGFSKLDAKKVPKADARVPVDDL